jgi:glycine betaine/proline transport system substrate-binding protein
MIEELVGAFNTDLVTSGSGPKGRTQMTNGIRKISKPLIASVFSLLMGATTVTAATITINDNPYPSFQAIKHLLTILFEERLGYDVETKPGENSAVWAGMDAGEGDFDIHADTWLPNQGSFYKKYVEDAGTVNFSRKPYHGSGGFCVPRYFYEEQNVKSVYDLARPEIAAQLDKDGDGKGEIWIGRNGWVSTNENMVKIRDYGLSENIQWVRAEVGVNQAAMGDAVKKHEGYATFCAKPDSVWEAYDLVQLDEPENDGSGCWKLVAQSEDDWYERSKITCGSAPLTMQMAWSTSLEKRAPLATELMANIELDIETVNKWSYQIGHEGMDPEALVRSWMEQNPERVDSWFGI